MNVPTLLCLPHAGGGRLFYERWRGLLGNDLDFRIAQYPNREQRANVPMPGTMEELVEELYTEWRPHLEGLYAVWGHSMGSVVAYELVKRAVARLDSAPLMFFSSGSSAPCDSRFRDGDGLGTSEGVDRILRRYGGLDETTLGDPLFMDYFRPIIKGDLELLIEYRDPAPTVLPCPLAIFHGEDDTVNVDNWTRYTDRPIDLTYFPGGHFFIADHARSIADAISTRLARATEAHAGGPRSR